MPFQIRWLTTRKKTRQAAYQSTHYPETGYIFNRAKTCTEWDLYTCSFCVSISKQKKNNQEHCPSIPTIRVIGDSFQQDPEGLNHICEGENIDRSWEKIIVGHYYNDTVRALKENAAEGGNRITGARSAQVLMERAIRVEDPHIVDYAPPMKKTKRIFNRAVSQFRQKAENPHNIPQALQQLGAPRPRNIGILNREQLDDFFLIYQDVRENMPPFLVFSCLTGIKQLHSMEFFCCDGTFEKSPKQFNQVYSLHAIHHELPQKMEATLIAFALMKTKSENEYRRFFDILSDKVQEEFGNLGGPKCFIFDHEFGAISACKQVYNRENDRVVSCYFHFSQNLIKNIGLCGLKPYWDDDSILILN